MKKKIFAIISVICIMMIFCINSFASGIYGTTTMNETSNTTSNGQCISLMITRPIVQEDIPPSIYTYSTTIDTSKVYNSRYNEYYFSSQNTTMYNNYYNTNEINYLTNLNVNTEISSIKHTNMNKISYFTNFYYSPVDNNAIIDKAMDIEAKYLGDNETIYIDKSYINEYIGNSYYAHTRGNAQIKKTVSCSAISMYTTNVNGIEKTKWEKHTVSGETEAEVAELLIETINMPEEILGATVYNTIGIFDYRVYYEITYTPDNSNQYQATLSFERPFEKIETKSANDFLSQNPNGNELGGTTTVVVEGDLNIASVVTAIKNALDVDLFYTISLLDILTIIVCISLTMWLLKVFAGG